MVDASREVLLPARYPTGGWLLYVGWLGADTTVRKGEYLEREIINILSEMEFIQRFPN